MSKKPKSEISSRSAYADLGFKNHEEMETKANLVLEISNAIKLKKITRSAAAKKLGITQPKLSELLRGRFREYSVERLIHFISNIEKNVNASLARSEQSLKDPAPNAQDHVGQRDAHNCPMS
jgi:predicted XRE-type DNA-binding protein